MLEIIQYQKDIWFEGGYDLVMKKLSNVNKSELYFWSFPDDNEIKNKELYTTTWSYFEAWDSYRNYLVAKKECGLQEADESNNGTFTNFAQNDQALYALHAYIMFLKFGFAPLQSNIAND